jgi:dihydrofolate reductase
MSKLSAFMQVTLDGYYASPDGGLDWAHRAGDDPDFQAFVAENAKGGGVLLFGRRTYEMMASYWPTPLAAEQSPEVAQHMNGMRKLVASRTLTRLDWENSELVQGDLLKRVGAGRTQLQGLKTPLELRLEETRAFKNGNVFLRYVAAR